MEWGSKQEDSLSGWETQEFMEELAFKMILSKGQTEMVGGKGNSRQRE